MPPIGTVYRTLRHLKCGQIYHQLLFRLRTFAVWQRPARVRQATAPDCVWPRGLNMTPPSGADACLDHASGRFRFIGLEHDFGGGIDWAGAGLGKLWDYNLHYFEWLWGLDPVAAKDVVDDWMARHPYAVGAVGWEPYPLSLRIQNWLAYWGTAGREVLESDEKFCGRLHASIFSQCDWLSRRLEKHLLGNHYLENGAALWMAGGFYADESAARWKALGRAILDEQLPEQILPDGMHFERSPMYHNRVVHLLSWLAAIDRPAFEPWLEKTQKVATWLCHPDGRIALFNDSAFGIYPEPRSPRGHTGEVNPDKLENPDPALSPSQPRSPRGHTGEVIPDELGKPESALSPSQLRSPRGYTGDFSFGPFVLPDAGYYGYRTDSGDYLIIDAGRIGPDYIPGHAHCDLLSFELSLGGKRFITDTGVFNYERNAERTHCRSTAAHNTFGPAGYEQAEIWAAFRVGRRPGVVVTDYSEDADEDCVLKARHDGFETGHPVAARHERHFYYGPGGALVIDDVFSADASLDWEGRLHFAPGVRVMKQDKESVLLEYEGNSVGLRIEQADGFAVVTSPYFPRFNEKQERLCIVYRAHAKDGMVRIALTW